MNAYISNFIYAFWARSYYDVAVNLIIILVIKQIGFNIIECFKYWFLNDRKIKKVKSYYKSKIEKEKDDLAICKLRF